VTIMRCGACGNPDVVITALEGGWMLQCGGTPAHVFTPTPGMQYQIKASIDAEFAAEFPPPEEEDR
jgi:hypothetical protein